MKLFLTGDDGVAAALGLEKLEWESDNERNKKLSEGRGGVFIAEINNRSPEEFGRMCP